MNTMALTQEPKVGKIEISGPYKILSVRTDKVIIEDGVEISRSFHRCTIVPGQDTSECDAEVQAVALAVHTDAIIEAYEESLENVN